MSYKCSFCGEKKESKQYRETIEKLEICGFCWFQELTGKEREAISLRWLDSDT